MKQFGLVDVYGRGKLRRLKLSMLGQRIVGETAVDPAERRNLIEKAALKPKIHREVWDRWRNSLPIEEVQTYLIQHRKFRQKGADALIAEYQKTMSFLEADLSNRPAVGVHGTPSIDLGHAPPSQASRSPLSPTVPLAVENFVDLRFEGDRLIFSACIGREGIPDLIRILRANQLPVGRKQNITGAGGKPSKRGKRRK